MDSLLDLLRLETPPWQMVLRGTAVYWFLLIVFRFLLRRDVGSLGVADLLFVVLIADASSNAMQGDYKTIGDGLVLISTLIAWNYALDWVSYRSPTVSRLLEPPAEPLVKHGRIMHRTLRRELITTEELMSKLREKGVSDLSEVRIARLEPGGELSVFKYRR
ncbi:MULTISPECIES: DUF421 domain-containing protein [unclassified Variovorax]|jgi:uncharacterized membrane protein YcaP (DUF421 family)|uniref:DUF421 domain-containing protein n=1 Tax=unclassified Variovorax TaxID=663243 RepID=UPI000C5C1844|nr:MULTISPECIES: YetF domain-containing protein [unclassified Variovorax]MBS76390.1 hypothetical protein [Variovorax sp.]MCT8177847.1 DUF421 domain-containing protein [Variovorax sp. CY25R-8]